MRKLRLVTDSSSKTQTAEASAETAQMLPSDDVSAALFDERFGQRTYYINIRIGSELRSTERLASEGQVRVSGAAFFYCLICSGAIMLFGTLCILYLLKSGLGGELSDGYSVLHPLFAMAGGQ
jgi:hypothetical protein